MEKLKKLYLNKKYLVKMKKEDFYNLEKYDIANLEEQDDFVVFKSNYKYENSANRYHFIFKKIIKNYLLIFFSIFGTFLIFFVSNYYIREIKFENELYYSKQIYDDVEKELKKIGKIYLIKKPINQINNRLSQKYYNYSYIGIVRNVGKIYIVIKPLPDYEKEQKNEDEKGNLVSKYNAYIIGVKLKQGVNLITINQMVRKGDLLITGNLKHHLSINNIDDYVHPIGNVFGKVVEEIEIRVPKTITVKMLTGEVSKYFQVLINNDKNILSNKRYYEEYEEVEKNIFNFGKIIKINRIFQYEKGEIIVEHNNDSSYKYACSEIEREFFKNKVDECEKIISYELIDSKIEEEFFYYKFKVKKIVDIAIFKKITN